MGTFVVYDAASYDPTDAEKESFSRELGMRKLGSKLLEKFEAHQGKSKKAAIWRAFRSILTSTTKGTDSRTYLVRYLTDVRYGDQPTELKTWDVDLLPGVDVDNDPTNDLDFKLINTEDPSETGSVRLKITQDDVGTGKNEFIMNIAVPRNSSIDSDFSYLDNVVTDLERSENLETKRKYLLGVTTFSRCR